MASSGELLPKGERKSVKVARSAEKETSFFEDSFVALKLWSEPKLPPMSARHALSLALLIAESKHERSVRTALDVSD